MLKDPKILEIQIEINENYTEQFNAILKIMKESNFKLKEKKRNDSSKYYLNEKFSKIYNYYFER